jgi:O-antigen/teichoic acid export membrane protein
MGHREKKTTVMHLMYVLAWALLFIAGAVVWIFFIGSTYFEIMRGDVHRMEGDWSALNHMFYLLFTAPLLISVAIFWGWWIRMGQQANKIKLAVTTVLLFVYGGVYLAFLWDTYPQQ